jgi:hypothetical protein
MGTLFFKKNSYYFIDMKLLPVGPDPKFAFIRSQREREESIITEKSDS